MVDPARLKDFLQRTSDALKRSMDSGNAEDTNKYSQMLDRAMPLAEKVSQQPQALPPAGPAGPQGVAGPETQEPVIPWGANQAKPAMPPAVATAEQAGPVVPNPFAMPQGGSKATLLTMPGGQATPQTSKGPASMPPMTGKESFVPIAPNTEMQKAWTGTTQTHEPVSTGPGPDLLDWTIPGVKTAKQPLDLPSAPKSKLEKPVFEREGELSDEKVEFPSNGAFEPELDEMIAKPADDVEAMALKRIKTEMADNRHPLMYLFTLLFLGAPRTFQMIMSDQSRHEEGVQRIYAQVRDEIARNGAKATALKFKEREVKSDEDRALAALVSAQNRGRIGGSAGEDSGDKFARTVLNNPTVDRKSEIYTESEKRALMKLKPPPQDTTIPR